MKIFLICIALAGGSRSIGAQSINVDLSLGPPKVPVILDLTHKTLVTLPSDVINIMPRCREGRCYGVFAVDPAHPFAERIGYFNTNGKSTTTDLAQLTDLKYVSVLDLAPTEDGMTALLHAQKKQEFGSSSNSDQRSGTAVRRDSDGSGTFLAYFSKEGEYKNKTHLELDFRPVRMAALSQNRIILSGFDVEKGTAVLAILQDDGTKLRRIDDEGVLPQKDNLLKATSLKLDSDSDPNLRAMAMTNALSGFEFGYAGEETLFLCSTNDGTSVLSILGGVVERKKLQMPVGVVASTVVPTDHGWLVRAFSSQADVGLLLEFDRDTGALIKQLDTSAVPPTSIILRSKGTYYALWSKDRRTYIVSSD